VPLTQLISELSFTISISANYFFHDHFKHRKIGFRHLKNRDSLIILFPIKIIVASDTSWQPDGKKEEG
jgi:hypothetical protein